MRCTFLVDHGWASDLVSEGLNSLWCTTPQKSCML